MVELCSSDEMGELSVLLVEIVLPELVYEKWLRGQKQCRKSVSHRGRPFSAETPKYSLHERGSYTEMAAKVCCVCVCACVCVRPVSH